MLKLAKKYQEYFDLYKTRDTTKKIFFAFILALPHIIISLIIILFYPQQWREIIIIGILLPDIFYFPCMFMYYIFPNYFPSIFAERMKTTAHILLFVIVIFLLIKQEYVLFTTGGIHLFLDILGF